MQNKEQSSSTYKRCIQALIKNPYLTHSGDKVLQQTLISWIIGFLEKRAEIRIGRREIMEIITMLTCDGIFTAEKSGSYVSLTATDRYEKMVASYSGEPFLKTEYTGAGTTEYVRILSPGITREGMESDYDERHLYYEYLLQHVDAYQGSYRDLVLYCPVLFTLISRIFRSETTPFRYKLLSSLAMSYQVLDQDVIPDWRECGYIDDLYVTLYILHMMIEEGAKHLIQDNWPSESDIINVIHELYPKITTIIGKRDEIILTMVGLNNINRNLLQV